MTRLLSFSFLLFLLPFLESPALSAQDSPLPKGIVIDTVKCLSQADHSYALYLPSNYTDTKAWPIIFMLEPVARGALPVDSFKMAAEKYGYLLLGSNNSRNGPFLENFEAAELFVADVQHRLTIDTNRMYFTGFSGGSRAATAVAVASKNIAGVIGCGAALPTLPNLHPTEESDYVYIGLVGNRDMNYQEMFELEAHLQKIGLPNSLRIFEAGHQWPPPSVLLDAVEWLELQAIKKGLRPSDSDFIDQQLQKRIQQIRKLQTREDWVEAAHQYKGLLRDFSDHTDLNIYEKELATLQQSKGYRKAAKQVQKIANNEALLNDKYTKAANRLLFPNPPDSLRNWWTGEIRRLKKMEAGNDLQRQMMAARLINILSAISVEWGRERMEVKQYESAAHLFKLGAQVHPDNYYFQYLLASAESASGKLPQALTTLEKAIKLGLNQKNWLQAPDFDPIRNSDRFQELLKRLE